MMVKQSEEYKSTLNQIALRLLWVAVNNDGEIPEVKGNIEFIADFFGVRKEKVESDLAAAMHDVNVDDLQIAKHLKEQNRLN